MTTTSDSHWHYAPVVQWAEREIFNLCVCGFESRRGHASTIR